MRRKPPGAKRKASSGHSSALPLSNMTGSRSGSGVFAGQAVDKVSKESPGGAFSEGGGRGFWGEERAPKGPRTRRVLARED